jgi:hypothetical protein
VIAITSVESAASAVEALSAARPTILLTSTAVIKQTSILSSENVQSTEAVSQSVFGFTAAASSTTFYTSAIGSAASPPALVLSPTDTLRLSQPMANGAKAGIAITVLITVSLIAVVIFSFVRWRKRAIDR